MLTSESEARKRWCPFVRIDGNNRVYNAMAGGFQEIDKSCHCIGKDCMAWREMRYSHLKGGDKSGDGHGYCGLSGRPEQEQGW